MRRQVTIKDLAHKLGLSSSTVSRALKDHPDISAKTKLAVKELAGLLGYKPNQIALNLRTNSTRTIGLIIPEVEHYFFSTIINGIEEVAYKNDYSVMVFQSNESYRREVLNTQTVMANRVDGVLVSLSKETRDYTHFQNLLENEIPIVFFDRVAHELNTDCVEVDDRNGAYTAVEHLIKKRCRKIALFTLPDHISIGKNRKEGYIKAITDYGLKYNEELVFLCDTYEQSREKAREILADKNSRPDGIFAVNDLSAIGVLKAARDLGISVPGQLKVIGFENSRPSSLTDPELSTIDQFGFQMGKEACQMLLGRLRNKDGNTPGVKKLIRTKLIERGST